MVESTDKEVINTGNAGDVDSGDEEIKEQVKKLRLDQLLCELKDKAKYDEKAQAEAIAGIMSLVKSFRNQTDLSFYDILNGIVSTEIITFDQRDKLQVSLLNALTEEEL